MKPQNYNPRNEAQVPTELNPPPTLLGISPLHRENTPNQSGEAPTLILPYDTPPRQIERQINQANTTRERNTGYRNFPCTSQSSYNSLPEQPQPPNQIPPLMQQSVERPPPHHPPQYVAPARTPTRPTRPHQSPRRQDSPQIHYARPNTHHPTPKTRQTHQNRIIHNTLLTRTQANAQSPPERTLKQAKNATASPSETWSLSSNEDSLTSRGRCKR